MSFEKHRKEIAETWASFKLEHGPFKTKFALTRAIGPHSDELWEDIMVYFAEFDGIMVENNKQLSDWHEFSFFDRRAGAYVALGSISTCAGFDFSAGIPFLGVAEQQGSMHTLTFQGIRAGYEEKIIPLDEVSYSLDGIDTLTIDGSLVRLKNSASDGSMEIDLADYVEGCNFSLLNPKLVEAFRDFISSEKQEFDFVDEAVLIAEQMNGQFGN